MKKTSLFIFIAAVATISVVSCKQKETPFVPYIDATVTFRPAEGGRYFLKQDDTTALIVKNTGFEEYPFPDGKEKRALITYSVNQKSTESVPGFKTTYDVHLYRIDTIYTKKPVVLKAGEDPDSYGDAPIGLYIDKDLFPTTMIEDGYLCVMFEMPMSNIGITHKINLLRGTDPEDPYTLELHHDMCGDAAVFSQAYLVNFPLKDLPDTEGKTVKLTLKWYSLATLKDESVTFDYKSRTDW